MATSILGGDLKLVANKTVANCGDILLAANSFSLGIETQGMNEGDSTQVLVIGSSGDAEEFNASTNNYMTDSGGEHVYKPVILNKHPKKTFDIPRKNFERLTPDDLAAMYKEVAQTVVRAFINDTFAKITASFFVNKYDVGDSLNFDYLEVGKIETELAKLVGESGERNLILNLDYFGTLRNSLPNISASPTNNEVLRNGGIPGLSGFYSTIRTTAFKSVGTAADEYLVGIATNRSGIAVATSTVYHIPQFDGDVEVAVDEVTGIPLTFSVDYSKDTRNYKGTVELLHGSEVMSEKGIMRLTSTVV